MLKKISNVTFFLLHEQFVLLKIDFFAYLCSVKKMKFLLWLVYKILNLVLICVFKDSFLCVFLCI